MSYDESIYEGFLKEEPKGPRPKVKSPADGAISNMRGGSLSGMIMGAPDFLRDSGVITGHDADIAIAAAAADKAADAEGVELELLAKLRKGPTIRNGSKVQHTSRGDTYIVLRTKVDISAQGNWRHLVVDEETGKKYKISEKLLHAI